MNIDIYNTHIELYPYIKEDYPIIEEMYTATDKFADKEYPCGYIIENNKLYLPRGTSISHIESITGGKVKFIKESDPVSKMTRKFYPLVDPRNELQERSIEFLKQDHKQMALNLSTGFGKSYCVCNVITELNQKALIISPNENIKMQWMNTFMKMFDYRSKNIMNIAGSNIIDGIMFDEINIKDIDIFAVNHQTLHSYLFSNNSYQFQKFFKKLKIGVKVYDEAHLNFMNILLIDFFSNTNKTIYLSATFDRSDKSESECFKKAFSSVLAYGEKESAEAVTKHVLYHVVNINSKIDQKNRAKIFSYPGYTSIKAGRYNFFYDDKNTMYNTIKDILNLTKNLEGKILLFVPLIEAVDDVTEKLIKDYPDKKIMAMHSKMNKRDKGDFSKHDLIITTIKSAGTGLDIPGLRVVINTENYASKITAHQSIGRLRPYKDKETYYFDIVDICVANNNYYFRARFKKIQTLVKKVIYLDMNK